MIGPVHHVTLSVSDLDRSVAFYSSTLGFEPKLSAIVDDDEHRSYLRLGPGVKGRATIMQAPGTIAGSVELIEWTSADGRPIAAPTPPKRPGDPGVCLLAFEVTAETLTEVFDRLTNHGISCWTAPVTMPIEGYGEISALVFEDPDGVMIELLTLPSPDEARRAHRDMMRSQGIT